MQVCTSLQTDNPASTSPLEFFYTPDALPAAQPTASKQFGYRRWLKIQYWPQSCINRKGGKEGSKQVQLYPPGNNATCWPIFETLSTTDLAVNLNIRVVVKEPFTSEMSLHYLAKYLAQQWPMPGIFAPACTQIITIRFAVVQFWSPWVQ